MITHIRPWLIALLTLAALNEGCNPVPCDAEETYCGGNCVDTSNNPLHCGGCGIACGDGQVCRGGACATPCAVGQQQCGGICTDTATDPLNCGSCGNACGSGHVCQRGVCDISCPPGQQRCGSTCVDTSSDMNHCGGCGITCGLGQSCQAGSCRSPCPQGQELCNGRCVDTDSDMNNCGTCGTACDPSQVCRAGACESPCPQGQRQCGGACVDTSNDPLNCGACGTACGSGVACTGGVCGGCQTGLTRCGQSCIDTNNDPGNCGACGNSCGQGMACIQGQCRVPSSCRDNLISPRTDAWGAAWDGLERVANNYAAAKQSCETLGARLPTASELFRVKAGGTYSLGSNSANYLWALTPNNPTQQFTVRLSDGLTAAVSTSATTRYSYRCVCTPPTTAFTGSACFGQPSQGCYALRGGGGQYNIDVLDRPALSKSGAVWECAVYNAHLADYATYVDGILSGLPNGTGRWLHTADDGGSSTDMLLKWTGISLNWASVGNTGSGSQTTLRPFRCAGVNSSTTPYPNSVSGEYVGPRGGYKGERSNPVQAAWELAHDTCWNRGGHLARSSELGELIQQGLPDGTGTWLWTADRLGFDGASFRTALVKWLGVVPTFGYSNPDFVTWGGKASVQRPFRCIYYPLDTQYTGPASGACNGGCMRFQLPGRVPALMWMDNWDRSSALLASAMGNCAAVGGRLASARDYTEAIRHGLPNGSGVHVLTSDLCRDERSTGYTSPRELVTILKWSSTNPSFDDQYPTYSTWSSLATARPYRCVWTNELR